jgi:hypothetical protein
MVTLMEGMLGLTVKVGVRGIKGTKAEGEKGKRRQKE